MYPRYMDDPDPDEHDPYCTCHECREIGTDDQPAVVMTEHGPQALLPGITPPDETKGEHAQRRMF